MYRRTLLSFYLIFIIPSIKAQNTDSLKSVPLKEVEIIDFNRLKHYSIGSKIEKIDSATLSRYSSNNLGDVLSQSNYLFIKTYSLGGLSTPSFRGTSANHTAVLWNGFNLQSPMNGTLDLALIPPEFVNEVDVQFGGKGALYGSGSVGGTIHLNNKARYNTGLSTKVTSNIGSYGNYRETAQLQVSSKSSITCFKVFRQNAINNFAYKEVQPGIQNTQIQHNAGLNQTGFLFEQYLKPSHNQQFNFRYWYQNSHREIPPLTGSLDSNVYQNDGFNRFTTEWQLTKPLLSLNIRSAFFDETLFYKSLPTLFNKIISISSFSHSLSSITEIESNIKLYKNQSINIGINETYSKAASDGYLHSPQLNRYSMFASYKITNIFNALNAVISGRQENYKGRFIPFTPSISLEYNVNKAFLVKGSVSRNYRVPTFNDLYWIQGGNPNLLPENGWSQEVGFTLNSPQLKINKVTISPVTFNTTAYNSLINNWIIWLPALPYWTPQNIALVWSRGVEFSLKLKASLNKVQLEAAGNYDFTVSTNEKVDQGSENQLHKQLIYTPYNKGSYNIGLSYKDFRLDINQSYTGFRYTTADNAPGLILPSYSLVNVQFSKRIEMGTHCINIYFRVNNLLNESYTVVVNGPMPQRNYLAGIAFQFNHLNKIKSP